MNSFKNADGYVILNAMVSAIQKNKDYLSEVDGLIGDGDHGMNMNKGFTLYASKYGKDNLSFSEGLCRLGEVLLTEIGGSMGPIYGTIFIAMGENLSNKDDIDAKVLHDAMKEAEEELFDIIDARVGDKTLVDAFSPAVDALEFSGTFIEALNEMEKVSENGMNKTKNLRAKYGRASRLGDRSIGILDAGSVSCNIILKAMGDSMIGLLGGVK